MRPRPAVHRKVLFAAAIGALVAMLAPAAFAGGPYGHHGNRHVYRSAPRALPRHHYSPAWRHVSRPAYRRGYGYGYYNYGYRGPRYGYGGYWRASDVVGALVAGALITSAISAASEPRRRVIEERVVRTTSWQDSYPDWGDYRRYPATTTETRYLGTYEEYLERNR